MQEEENQCGKKYSGHEKKKSCPVTLCVQSRQSLTTVRLEVQYEEWLTNLPKKQLNKLAQTSL